ncbi:hypothetical protein, partial [Mariniphaga sediminis]|uniref:hypothetical protein n=1 Tax=Mariniphaga sediminis TaxID=1628158 RepID=UPI00356921A8
TLDTKIVKSPSNPIQMLQNTEQSNDLYLLYSLLTEVADWLPLILPSGELTYRFQLDKLHAEVEEADEESRTLGNAHIVKLYYGYIWNNLSRMEKLILFDLADDGVLNFKNRFLINWLKSKGLIELEPYPSIFTPGFQYFLKYSIDPDEKTLLEQKLSKYYSAFSRRVLRLVMSIADMNFVGKSSLQSKIFFE